MVSKNSSKHFIPTRSAMASESVESADSANSSNPSELSDISYTLDELERYAQENFLKGFALVSDPDLYTFETRDLCTVENENLDGLDVLRIGSFKGHARGDIWALVTDINNKYEIQMFHGKPGNRLIQFYYDDPAKKTQIRLEDLYKDASWIGKNRAGVVPTIRDERFQRLMSLVAYAHMLHKTNVCLNAVDEDMLKLFKEACGYVLEAKEMREKESAQDALNENNYATEDDQDMDSASKRTRRSERKPINDDTEPNRPVKVGKAAASRRPHKSATKNTTTSSKVTAIRRKSDVETSDDMPVSPSVDSLIGSVEVSTDKYKAMENQLRKVEQELAEAHNEVVIWKDKYQTLRAGNGNEEIMGDVDSSEVIQLRE